MGKMYKLLSASTYEKRSLGFVVGGVYEDTREDVLAHRDVKENYVYFKSEKGATRPFRLNQVQSIDPELTVTELLSHLSERVARLEKHVEYNLGQIKDLSGPIKEKARVNDELMRLVRLSGLPPSDGVRMIVSGNSKVIDENTRRKEQHAREADRLRLQVAELKKHIEFLKGEMR